MTQIKNDFFSLIECSQFSRTVSFFDVLSRNLGKGPFASLVYAYAKHSLPCVDSVLFSDLCIQINTNMFINPIHKYTYIYVKVK